MGDNQEKALNKMLTRAEALKVFPAAALRIQAVAEDPNSCLKDLELAVSIDTTLSAKILKIANSPFYGLNRNIASLKQALLIMGFWATRNMALALTMLSSSPSHKSRREYLWSDALRVAATAQQIAVNFRKVDAQESFVCGMLHDIGRLIMIETNEETYIPVLEENYDQGIKMLELERELFSFDHAVLGAACLERWNLPQRTVLAVRYHHCFSELPGDVSEKERQFAAILNLSNLIKHSLDQNKEKTADIWDSLAETEAASILGFDAKSISAIAVNVQSGGEPFVF